MRHLDFLIHNPERSLLLAKGGIPVTIPRAERYAVHKLIVSVERQDQVKSAKDTMQAGRLIEALATRRPLELAKAWQVAWEEGPRWRDKLDAGRGRLSEDARQLLADVLEKGARSRSDRVSGGRPKTKLR